MRVTQELLYDSEATLRLVDRVLDDLDMSDHFRSARAGTPHCRTEQLRCDVAESDAPSASFLRAYWEIQDALEMLRDSHAALQPVRDGSEQGSADEHDRLSRALSVVDQLQSEENDPRREQAHEALRLELLALAEHLRCREQVNDRLHFTADLLWDLELRLAQLSRVLDSRPGDFRM